MHLPPTVPDPTVREPRVTSVEIRAALEDLDSADLMTIFSRRARVAGHPRISCEASPQRIAIGHRGCHPIRPGEFHQSRVWKLFLSLPSLLHRHPRGGKVLKSKLVERVHAATAHTRKRRQYQVGDVPRRAA